MWGHCYSRAVALIIHHNTWKWLAGYSPKPGVLPAIRIQDGLRLTYEFWDVHRTTLGVGGVWQSSSKISEMKDYDRPAIRRDNIICLNMIAEKHWFQAQSPNQKPKRQTFWTACLEICHILVGITIYDALEFTGVSSFNYGISRPAPDQGGPWIKPHNLNCTMARSHLPEYY